MDTLSYLISQYWIYLLIALLIGGVTGWLAAGRPAA